MLGSRWAFTSAGAVSPAEPALGAGAADSLESLERKRPQLTCSLNHPLSRVDDLRQLKRESGGRSYLRGFRCDRCGRSSRHRVKSYLENAPADEAATGDGGDAPGGSANADTEAEPVAADMATYCSTSAFNTCYSTEAVDAWHANGGRGRHPILLGFFSFHCRFCGYDLCNRCGYAELREKEARAALDPHGASDGGLAQHGQLDQKSYEFTALLGWRATWEFWRRPNNFVQPRGVRHQYFSREKPLRIKVLAPADGDPDPVTAAQVKESVSKDTVASTEAPNSPSDFLGVEDDESSAILTVEPAGTREVADDNSAVPPGSGTDPGYRDAKAPASVK